MLLRSPPRSLSETVPQWVLPLMRAQPALALSVGVTHQGEHRVWSFAGDGHPPAPEALYALGSLTQIFTGTLLALLVDRGELRLETPLGELIPRSLLPDEAAGRITLEQLATHTSGMPYEPGNLRTAQWSAADPYGHYNAMLFGEFLRGYRPTRAPPRRPSESLIGMGVLGHALSRRVKLNYGHAVRDWLCTPLKLNDTVFRPDEAQAPRVRPGHTANGERMSAWTWPALPGAGAFYSTVPDLLRFLDVNLGQVKVGLNHAARLAHTPRVKTWSRSLGLGWNVTRGWRRQVMWRSSTLGGYTGFIGFCPGTDTGVVLLADHAPPALAGLLRRLPLETAGFKILRASGALPGIPSKPTQTGIPT